MHDPNQHGEPAARTAAEVFDSHLEFRRRHDLEGDLAANYDDNVVLMTMTGMFRGKDGVRACAAQLHHYLPDGEYEYLVRTVEGELAFLVWHGQSAAGDVHDGADTFLIRNGRILAQTIHYTVDHRAREDG